MTPRPKQQNGFVILIVLVAVAIVMMLYMVNMTAIFGPSLKTDSSEKPLWREEHRIVGPDVFIKLPKTPKPLLDNPVSITGQVTRKDSYRGEITIEFNTIGEVSGAWKGSYLHDYEEYTFDAKFVGNIDVSKTYSAKEKKDKSKLYFITKGNYTQTVFNKRTENVSAIEGVIYAAGWLNPDYSANGKLQITTEDKDFSAKYLWQSQSQE